MCGRVCDFVGLPSSGSGWKRVVQSTEYRSQIAIATFTSLVEDALQFRVSYVRRQYMYWTRNANHHYHWQPASQSTNIKQATNNENIITCRIMARFVPRMAILFGSYKTDRNNDNPTQHKFCKKQKNNFSFFHFAFLCITLPSHNIAHHIMDDIITYTSITS